MKVEQSFSINFTVNSGQSGEAVAFPSFPTLSIPSGLTLVSQKLEMLNLQAKVVINSQTPLTLPSIPVDASSSDIALIANNLAWGNPRLQMDLLVGNSGNWNPVATESLVDVSPVPYRNYDLLSDYGPNPATIDPALQLAVRVYDVGYGGLQSEDFVVVWGDFLMTSYLYEGSQQPVINVTEPTINVTEPTPTINLNVEGSISSNSQSYGTVGNCSGGNTAPVSGSGQWFQFSTPVTNQQFNISVAPGVNIVTAGDAIIVHRWNQQPTNSFVGKEEPPIATLSNAGGIFAITSDTNYQWFTLGMRDPNQPNNGYRLPFFTVSGNQITIVG